MKEIEKMEENRDYLYDVVRNCILAHTQCEKKDAEDELDKMVGGKTNKNAKEHIKKIREAEKELSKYDAKCSRRFFTHVIE